MKKQDAIKLRDNNKEKLVGLPFDRNKEGWDIKDLVIASRSTIGDIYTKMWDNNISNELALGGFSIKDDDYDVFIISHQWSWGSGDLLYERLDSYYKANPS
jgi:hypothetical protein